MMRTSFSQLVFFNDSGSSKELKTHWFKYDDIFIVITIFIQTYMIYA